MIVMSRRKNDQIVIGDDIQIVVVEVTPDRVRLGIECPSDMPVYRQEVFAALRKRMNDEQLPDAGGH